jgi:hypothetical protein
MSTEISRITRLERLLAGLLHYGTWLASGVTALGILLALIEHYVGWRNPGPLSGTPIVTAGIALFIVLPVARVALMLVQFALERDYRFVVITALVLMVILLGFALGMYLPTQSQGAH